MREMATLHDQCRRWAAAHALTATAIRWITEEGGRIHPIGEEPMKATAAWLRRLQADYSVYESLLRHCPGLTTGK